MSPPLRIVPGRTAGTVSLAGQLDAESAPWAAHQLAPHVSAPGDARLDLSQLDGIEEEGLEALREIARGLPPGARLVLLSPTKDVRAALEESGLLGGRIVIGSPAEPATSRAPKECEEDWPGVPEVALRELSTPSELPFIWLG